MKLRLVTTLFALGALLGSPGLADPCGMVPPISIVDTGGERAIERIGVQKTYTFYRDGIQTLVLRPGFRGKSAEFGMLIPFPAVPAIRKIADDTFAHLAAAVDPPKAQIHIYDPMPVRAMRDMPSMAAQGSTKSAAPASEDAYVDYGLKVHEVKVLKQEAIGMYEVAVLAAGSPKALEAWMTDHAYRYPDGMADVVEEYILEKWCFVAIKAKVGAVAGVSPHPGMRGAKHELPTGASFDGHVQGMGFRFRVPRPVVPMRLSTFNGEDLHNLVYAVGKWPVKIDGVPADLVRRQLAGADVHRNLNQPIPVTVHNGSWSEIPASYLPQIQESRRPEKYSGIARDLLAADLLAVRTDTLALPYEKREKELLNISEAFAMRGAAVDQLHQGLVATERARALERAIDDLYEMAVTVVDGDFPRNHLQDHNLTFSWWAMPRAQNNAASWSQRPAGPSFSVPRNRARPTGLEELPYPEPPFPRR